MRRRLVIICGYIVATLVVIVGTVALIAYGNGVSYDFATGRVVHNGLIILQSTPSGAEVTLGDKVQHQTTPYRHSFQGGNYLITLTKNGYRTWQKLLWVEPSRADLAQYVILLSQHLSVAIFGTYPAISQSLPTHDHRLVGFVVPSGPTAGVWTLDTGSHQQSRIYATAPADGTTPAETVQLVSWAADNSRLLIKSQVGDKNSLLVVSAGGGAAPVNIDATFSQDIDTASFSPFNSRQLYWLASDATLHRLDLGNQTLSAPLADHVMTFTYTNDRLLYVSAATATPSLWSLDTGGTKTRLVSSLPPSTSYELAFANYLGTPEAAVVAQDGRTATLYGDIYNRPIPTTLTGATSHALFNGDGRFLLLYDDQHVATYDLQRNLTYTMPPLNATVTGISWFDPFHLVFNRGGQIVLSEFDGNYAVVVTRGDALPPTASGDTKSVIATSATSNGSTLLKAIKIRQ